MGKRSRNRSAEEPEVIKTREEELAEINRDYHGLKRMMTMGAIGVVILIIGLALRQPGGWVAAAIILGVIEGVSYPLLLRSLARRRDERVANLNSGE